jgi:hypothetical protein
VLCSTIGALALLGLVLQGFGEALIAQLASLARVKAADLRLVITAAVALEALVRLIEAFCAEVEVAERIHHTAAVALLSVGEESFFLHLSLHGLDVSAPRAAALADRTWRRRRDILGGLCSTD